jgi:hypothetical protein
MFTSLLGRRLAAVRSSLPSSSILLLAGVRRTFGVGEGKRRRKLEAPPFERYVEKLPKNIMAQGKNVVKYWISYSSLDTADNALQMMAMNKVELLKEVSETFGMALGDFIKAGHTVEFFRDNEWIPLKCYSDLKGGLQNEFGGARIRVPAFFDQDGDIYPEEDELAFQGERLQYAVQRLLATLKEKGWSPISTEAPFYGPNRNKLQLINKETSEIVSTKGFVLQKSSEDEDLKNLLVARVGSLSHIASCHFNWKPDGLTKPQPLRRKQGWAV